MATAFHFTFEKDWRHAPLAFWVHLPTSDAPYAFWRHEPADGSAGAFAPPAPREIPHKGYAVLRVQFEMHELQFSAPEQLDHFIQVLSSTPLPTTRQLSSRLSLEIGPNSHWLSRLPAALKAPKKRAKLVDALRSIRETVAGTGRAPSFKLPDPLF